jgi:NADP-dependent 3-hydroxy acid dehydrogenase YdfG
MPFTPALITGASSGIGRAIAVALAGRGGAVGLLARRRDHLEAVAAACEAAGGRAHVAVADVRDRGGCLRAAEAVEAALGPVELLVVNAGVAREADPLTCDGDAFAEEVAVNVLGAHHAIEAVVPGMLRRGRGHVVALSSLAAWRGLPGSAGYSATKAALTTLLQGYRIDWRRHGVRTTTVHPGFVKSELTAKHTFPMPLLMEADRAAAIILRAVERGKKTCNFPWRLAMLTRLGRWMPDRMLGWFVGRGRSRAP